MCLTLHIIELLLCYLALLLSSQLKARFLKVVYKALEHYNSTTNNITRHACRNPMSVCGRNRHDIVGKNGYVGMNVKEIYNEWYKTLSNEEMDCISVLKEMIDIREGKGSCNIFNVDDMLHIINDICTN